MSQVFVIIVCAKLLRVEIFLIVTNTVIAFSIKA